MKAVEFRSENLGDAASLRKEVERLMHSGESLWLVPAPPESESRLEAAGQKAQAQELVAALTLAEGVRTFHNQLGQRLSEGEIWKTAKSQLGQLFDEMTTLIHGIYLLGECSQRALTVLDNCAERAGVIAVAAALQQKDASVVALWERTPAGDALDGFQTKLKLEVSERIDAGDTVVAPLSLGRSFLK